MIDQQLCIDTEKPVQKLLIVVIPVSSQRAASDISKLIREVYAATGITATAGIGTNLYLCKVAMDIVAKHVTPDGKSSARRFAASFPVNFLHPLYDLKQSCTAGYAICFQRAQTSGE